MKRNKTNIPTNIEVNTGEADFAAFCDQRRKKTMNPVDKDLINRARENGCIEFADSCEDFLKSRGELTTKQRNALAKWSDDFSQEDDDDYDHDGLTFGDVC